MKERKFNGNRLKLIAVISMVCDHTAVTLLSGPAVPVLRTAGRAAFPLFVFLMTEGAARTKDWRRYAARLSLFALLSEIPYDRMCRIAFGRENPLYGQNVMVTLLLGLFMVRGLMWMQSRALFYGGTEKTAQTVWICLWAALAAFVRCDYGACGPVLAGIYALFRPEPRRACAAGFLWMGLTCAGPRWYYWIGYAAAFALVAAYCKTRAQAEPETGKRCSGTAGRLRRYAWYWIYPVHMAVLCALAAGLRR